MSAYFCQDSTFHLIATYAATVDATADLETIWKQLIQENLKSLNHRHPNDQADNVGQARAALAVITNRPALPLPEPGIIKSAIREYDYQSCEHPGYSSSAAGKLVAQLLATIDAPAATSPDGGWYDTDTIGTPQPAPGPDPIKAARASLMAAFNAPAAPEPQPAPEPEPTPKPAPDRFAMWHDEAKARALALLLTLERVSDGDPNSIKFGQLAERIGATMEQQARAEASREAARNAAALQSAFDCAS